ncbi:MAG: ABC transporter permease [Gemmatimonadota bacterium]
MTFRDPRIEDELRHHIEERADRLVAEGVEPNQARRIAETAFGDAEAIGREISRIHDARRSPVGRLLDRVVADVGFALRQLRRSPGFALAATLTLGLGIGASASIFALVKAVVLDPLPYANAERLVLVNEISPTGVPFTVSDLNYRDFRERLEGVDRLSAFSRADYATSLDGQAVQVVSGMVTGDFFALFGGTPVRGRTFAEAESGATPAPVVVLSHDFWMERYGDAADVTGSTLLLDDVSHEIAGVMPDGWEPVEGVDVWTPLALAFDSRDNHDYTVLGRLADGTGLAGAEREIQAEAEALGREYPATNEGWSAQLVPLKEAWVGPERRQAGHVLLGAVALLLLMACASVSNLLLARASARGREMALRATLGAGRWRLVQQLLTESVLLAGIGAALGLVCAYLFLPVLQALSPPDTPRLDAAAVSGTVVLFAAGVALSAAVIFGLAPVLHVLRDALSARDGTRTTGGSGDRLRGALVAGQVALSLTLLIGAGALGRSFLALQQVDPGLPTERAVVVPLMMSGDRYTPAERRTTRDAIVAAVAGIPAVSAAGSTNVLPFSGMNTMVAVNVEGRPTEPGTAPFVRWRAVSPGFFDAAALSPLAGRTMEGSDYEEAGEPVVVLTEAMARLLFDDPRTAVGERVAMGWDGRNYRRVVGVVRDVEDRALEGAPPPVFFIPDPGVMPWVNLVVRFRPDVPAPTERALREAVWSVDPGLPVPSVESLGDRFEESVAGYGFNLLIVGSFAGVALVLALLGIYGLVLFSVERRTREIGVRIALGARPERVARLILGQGLRLAAVGIIVGIALSLGLSRFLQTLLYGVEATHPVHFVAPVLVLAVAALAATWAPAAKATRIAPREALVSE